MENSVFDVNRSGGKDVGKHFVLPWFFIHLPSYLFSQWRTEMLTCIVCLTGFIQTMVKYPVLSGESRPLLSDSHINAMPLCIAPGRETFDQI